MSRIEQKTLISKGLPIKRESEIPKEVVSDNGSSETIYRFSIFPSGWRVLDKKKTSNVNYYLLISCNYNKETGELSKSPALHENENIFKIVKESVSKFDKFSGGMQKIPDFRKTHPLR